MVAVGASTAATRNAVWVVSFSLAKRRFRSKPPCRASRNTLKSIPRSSPCSIGRSTAAPGRSDNKSSKSCASSSSSNNNPATESG